MLNQALTSELQNWPKAQLVYSNLALTDNMLAADGFHPSELGSKKWAQLVFNTIERNLQLN